MRKGTRLNLRCPKCGRAFKQMGSLAKHKQSPCTAADPRGMKENDRWTHRRR